MRIVDRIRNLSGETHIKHSAQPSTVFFAFEHLDEYLPLRVRGVFKGTACYHSSVGLSALPLLSSFTPLRHRALRTAYRSKSHTTRPGDILKYVQTRMVHLLTFDFNCTTDVLADTGLLFA